MVQLCRYFFFFENAKNLGRLDDTKWEKKEDGLNDYVSILANNIPANFF